MLSQRNERAVVLRRTSFKKAIQRGSGVEVEHQRNDNIPTHQCGICQPEENK